MLNDAFFEVYTKFKLNFYKSIFKRFERREATLTAVETFCAEVIHALGRPTVNEFATFVNISQANAAYKVNSLIKKGYVRKVQSKEDRREFYLVMTDKFLYFYNISNEYAQTVMKRTFERISEEDAAVFEHVLRIMSDELMPEIHLKQTGEDHFLL